MILFIMQKPKTRIFVNKTISSNLIIYVKNKQHHFLKNVMRIKIDDKINVFDGQSGEWISKVISVNRESTALRVTENIKKMLSSPDIWLIFSPIRQSRMSTAIQKATEIGVSKIIPCITEYTNIKNINEKNLSQNTVEASEQSLRLDIPSIEKEIDLKSLLESWPMDRKLIYCNEKNTDNTSIIETMISIKNTTKKWAVLVGPEGGFSSAEQDLILKNNNVISVSLGKTILRSDTAITVALFCIKEITS